MGHDMIENGSMARYGAGPLEDGVIRLFEPSNFVSWSVRQAPQADADLPKQIGRYRIVRLLGEGGSARFTSPTTSSCSATLPLKCRIDE